MLLIGQSLEFSRPDLADALRLEAASTLVEAARAQIAAGAGAIDLNAGTHTDVRDLAWCARAVRVALPDVPLFIDTATAVLLAEVLDTCAREGVGGRLVANSIAVDMMGALDEEAHVVVRVAARTGAGVVISPRLADTLGEIADAEYVAYAGLRSAERARTEGVTAPVYIDALAFPAISDPVRCARALATLRGWARVEHAEPLLAIGNVSYGATGALASTLRATYAAAAIGAGARALILPVEDPRTVETVRMALGERPATSTEDAWLLDVTAACRTGETPPTAPPAYAEAARLLFSGATDA